MKKVLILIFGVVSTIAFGQTKYEQGMQKAMQTWEQGKIQEALAILARISDADQQHWIPAYYQVMIAITQGFQHPQEATVEGVVERNRLIIDQWIEKKEAVDEWYVLQGMNETLELMMDPMQKGMSQSPIITKAYENALEFNPTNPRAIYLLASFYLNSAKFMKVDVVYHLERIKQALVLFDQQKKEILFYPTWGKEWAEKIRASVEEKNERKK